MDAYRGLQPGTIPTRAEMIRAYIPGSKQALSLADDITRLTFDNVQRKFKVVSFALHREAWMHDNPSATPDQFAEAKRGIASYVNGVFGGLHWENMGIPRVMIEIGRLMLLAPDWSGSNVALAKYAFDAPLSAREVVPTIADALTYSALKVGRPLAGAVTKEAVQARLARAFWTKQIVQGLAENQMLSLVFSGKLSPRPFQVYQGKDDDGRDIYQNVVFRGSVGDAISLGTKIEEHGALGAGVFLGSKAAPFAKAAIHIETGRNDFGQQIVKKGLNPVAKTVRGVGTIAGDVTPVPIVVRQLYRMAAGEESDQYVWSEKMLSLFGPAAQHMPPEGMKWSAKYGLQPAHESEPQSVWDEILTGKR
jgi:hypothetical protein